MHNITRVVLACGLTLTLGTPALAHHSAAAFDTGKQVTVTGSVVQYRFANPHVYITLEVKRDDGTMARMEVEAGAASVLNGLGFNKDSVTVGEVVTVTGNPGRREPEKLLLGRDLYKRDGAYVPLNISSRSVYEAKINATASSIAGTWFPPRTEFFGFMGSVGKWPLTEKARAAMKSADPKATTQKDCIPLGAPALMFYPVASTIEVQRDRVLLKVDWMDTERVVYLDGRPHPPASQTFLHGHSVGRWEGKTLVVETTNFQDHAMGTSASLPGSTQKRLVERFAVDETGRNLIYSGIIEDPVYLTKPAEWSGKWEYRPGMPHSNQKCDVEVARRFLAD